MRCAGTWRSGSARSPTRPPGRQCAWWSSDRGTLFAAASRGPRRSWCRPSRARGHEVLFLTPRRQYPQWLFPGASDRDPDACREIGVRGAGARADESALLARQPPEGRWPSAPTPGSFRIGPGPGPAGGGISCTAAGRRRLAWRTTRPITTQGRCGRSAARGVLSRCQAIFTHARILESGLAREYPGVPTASHPLTADGGREAARAGRRPGSVGSARRSESGVVHGLDPALQGSRSPD